MCYVYLANLEELNGVRPLALSALLKLTGRIADRGHRRPFDLVSAAIVRLERAEFRFRGASSLGQTRAICNAAHVRIVMHEVNFMLLSQPLCYS
jgi:hypothetical protein